MQQRRSLEGQVALVTGGSSGIGRACALALGAAGASVVVNYRGDAEAAAEVVRLIGEAGSQAVAVQADVSEEAAVERLFAATRESFGTLHILVSNAGIQQDRPLVEMSAEDWQKVIDVNLTGQFLCARAAVREFLRRGRQPEISRATGKIVCMSSVHEVIPWACRVNYAASKGGLMMFMKSLAQEHARDGIRVNSIAPGAIRTDINRDAWETGEARQELLRLIPYGRIGDPEDVARAALWLASDDSDYVTGTTLFVDGGMLLYPGFAEGGG
ncbi:SDR family oxidoreductase [Geminicoccaceae bacterium 1502E]|nr:SDR family oxidoreductase [Geminicoccaceae bacterium 1502E]